jgi:hypothetical protein
MNKVIQKIKADYRVRDVSDERLLGDGFWVYLKDGYCYDQQEQHIIHENSPSACMRQLPYVQPCHCQDCNFQPN